MGRPWDSQHRAGGARGRSTGPSPRSAGLIGALCPAIFITIALSAGIADATGDLGAMRTGVPEGAASSSAGMRKLHLFSSSGRRSERRSARRAARMGGGEEGGGGDAEESAGGDSGDAGYTPSTSAASSVGFGKKIKGPNTSVPNCKSCPTPVIPEMCNFIPASSSSRRLLSEDDNVAANTTNAPEGDVVTAFARRLLGSSRRTAFQSGRRRGATKTRQNDFKPPSDSIKSMVMSVLNGWKANSACGLWTKDCVKRYLGGETMGLRKGPDEVFKGRKFPPGGEELFPDLKPGELGSCAVVAAADTVLGQKRGPEIDAHDTVFRYNGPIKKYKGDIGQKGDVYYWKMRSNERQYGQEGQRANKFYMWKAPMKYYMFGSKDDFPKLTFHGKKILWETTLAMQLGEVYSSYQKENRAMARERHAASGGFKLALSILSSGLCKRVDMYGYSAAGTGRYFKDALVNTVHIIGLEHWVYRMAMEAGMACIYN